MTQAGACSHSICRVCCGIVMSHQGTCNTGHSPETSTFETAAPADDSTGPHLPQHCSQPLAANKMYHLLAACCCPAVMDGKGGLMPNPHAEATNKLFKQCIVFMQQPELQLMQKIDVLVRKRRIGRGVSLDLLPDEGMAVTIGSGFNGGSIYSSLGAMQEDMVSSDSVEAGLEEVLGSAGVPERTELSLAAVWNLATQWSSTKVPPVLVGETDSQLLDRLVKEAKVFFGQQVLVNSPNLAPPTGIYAEVFASS